MAREIEGSFRFPSRRSGLSGKDAMCSRSSSPPPFFPWTFSTESLTAVSRPPPFPFFSQATPYLVKEILSWRLAQASPSLPPRLAEDKAFIDFFSPSSEQGRMTLSMVFPFFLSRDPHTERQAPREPGRVAGPLSSLSSITAPRHRFVVVVFYLFLPSTFNEIRAERGRPSLSPSPPPFRTPGQRGYGFLFFSSVLIANRERSALPFFFFVVNSRADRDSPTVSSFFGERIFFFSAAILIADDGLSFSSPVRIPGRKRRLSSFLPFPLSDRMKPAHHSFFTEHACFP